VLRPASLQSGPFHVRCSTGRRTEESGEYRVTRHKALGPGRSPKVIFRHLDEAPAMRFYKRIPPAPGYVISLWHPDGTLIASTSGPAPAS
jgi:hypothetical protein